MAKGPNTVKFMNRMIDEYRAGKLNDKQVCASIRRITNINERQCAYCNTRIALKMFNKMPMNYMCKEPCAPSVEETMVDKEEHDMLYVFLDQLQHDYPDWEERLNDSDRERFGRWIVDIRRDILKEKYGKEIRQYLEDVWLRKKRLFKALSNNM